MLIDLIISNAHIIVENDVLYGNIAIKDGKIISIGTDSSNLLESVDMIDAKGAYLLPGGVDPHVHIRYPGGTLRETFYTGSCAAAAGGTTTVIEHPISTPPQYSPETLQPRVDKVQEESIIDVAFLGAAGNESINEIPRIAQAGIVGFKTFLHSAPEGREKEFFGLTSANNYELLEVMKEVKKTGLPFAAHGEDNDLVSGAIAKLRSEGRCDPIDHAYSRPPLVEVLAVERLIRLAKETGCSLYLVHISTPEAVEVAQSARADGIDLYIETCPQYLYLTDDALIKYGSYAKCNPALRDEERVDKMWKYIIDGTIDTIGSDHSPYTVEEKERNPHDIFLAPAGFPGLETRMGLMLKAVADKKISLQRAVELISTNPAKAYGLYPQKGVIKVGADADLILCDPDAEYTVDHNKMFTMSRDVAKVFDGWKLNGVIDKTFLRGNVIYDSGEIKAQPGSGRWISNKKG